MDYVKAYNEILESHTKQIDVMNFLDNKLSSLDLGENDFEKTLERIKDTYERAKEVQLNLLKQVSDIEMLLRFQNE